MKVDINKIIELEKYLSEVNRADLEDLEFYDGEKKLEIDPEYIKDFKFRGLCNTDFIVLDFYKIAMGIDLNDEDDENFSAVEESEF